MRERGMAGMERALALVDMAVMQSSPAGSCVRTIVNGLAWRSPVEIWTAQCDLPDMASVTVHSVPAASRPVLLRYVTFHARVARRLSIWLKRRSGAVVQATQGQFVGAEIVYAHFCHGAYLASLDWRAQWRSLRFWARWATHAFNAWRERLAFEVAQCVVVPSQGLKRELLAHYRLPASHIEVLANPVDVAKFARPDDFDVAAARRASGVPQGRIVLSFMALGDFERKGLGILMDAIAGLAPGERAKLSVLVIGGQPSEIAAFQARAQGLSLQDHFVFVGLHKDVRPYLWQSDMFAFPSLYEIFSLAILQAAAASLPVLVSQGLYGAEEFVRDGVNGWAPPREPGAVREVLRNVVAQTVDLAAMGREARQSVMPYEQAVFCRRWAALYARFGVHADVG